MTFLTEYRPELMNFMVVAMIIKTIYHIKHCNTYRKNAGNSKDMLEENLLADIVINSIAVSLFLLLFFGGFKRLVFYSATKFTYMAIYFIVTMVAQWAYYYNDADMFSSTEESVKAELCTAISVFCFLVRLIILIIVVSYTIVGYYGHFFGKIVSQEESVSYIYPESVGEVKIAHIKDTNEYAFFTDEDGTLTLNRLVFLKEEIVKGSDETYIQVTTIQKNGIDEDRKKDDPEYAYTEESEKMRLFINEEEMIQICVKE
ncbi:MAG: hypothetical protein K6D97_08120 [Clostridia bacterium]|nr:hypothetical protein [Clostridia bacterium]